MKKAILALVLTSAAATGATVRPAPEEIRFVQDAVTVWLDRSQVVSFVAPASDTDVTFTARAEDPDVIEILRVPALAAGETRGYLRLRGLTVGETRLSIGDVNLDVHVAALPAEAPVHRASVCITTPVSGARAWGLFSVGVEARGAGRGARVLLETGGGEQLEPVSVIEDGGLALRARFAIDAAGREGALELLPIVRTPSGLVRGEPVRVTVLDAEGLEVFAHECEAHARIERPREFGDEGPRLGTAPGASGGAFVVLERPEPTPVMPFDVEEAGLYQVMVVARGDLGAGAFPSIGLEVDAPRATKTAARVADRVWHRIALGRPVALEAGRRTLGLRYLNDSSISSTSDRNLYLDRFEIARIDRDSALVSGPIEASTFSVARTTTTGSMADSAMMAGAMQPGGASGGLRIAWKRPLDGLPVHGRLELEGYCRYPAMADVPAPRVDLVLNARVVATQQAVRPLFALDRAALVEGDNTLQLVALLADGSRAQTPVQTVVVEERGDGPEPRATHRFSVHDERWNAPVRASFSGEGQELGHAVARPLEPMRCELALPADLEGTFDVLIDGRGPTRPKPAARVGVHLRAAGDETLVHDLSMYDWWSQREAGVVTLAAGPKTLVLEIDPGPSAGRDGLAWRAVFLRTHRAEPDRVPPRAEIVYPAPGHEAFGVDAVVARAFDGDDRLQRGDVLIDGQPQGSFTQVATEGVGYLVFPLILREVPPGEHTLTVRVRDHAGNVGESQEIPFTVRAEAPETRGPYARAVHLANRFGFGPDANTLAAILTVGERAWLEASLAAPGAGDEAALGAAFVRRLDESHGTLRRSVVAHLLRTPNPAWSRLALWVGDHFSTWIWKTRASAEWAEYLTFRELGPAPFGELLAASATSPAMLAYLDQVNSYSGHLNENYAREIMELHTLGVDGGYTQEEVTELAWLLTGVTASEEAPLREAGGPLTREFRFDPELSDGEPRQILGMRFDRAPPEERFDRLLLVLELLAAHPSTARFVAAKLAEHYVSAPAPDDLARELTRVFQTSGGDLAAVLLAIQGHPSFQASAPRLANPLDWALRLGRATRALNTDWALQAFLDRSGMGLFDRVTPDAYPEEEDAWAHTNALVQRWRLVKQIQWAVNGLVPYPLRPHGGGDPERWRQRVVDVAAVRLTGSLLADESSRAAMEFVATDRTNTWVQSDNAALFVSRTPEANLR